MLLWHCFILFYGWVVFHCMYVPTSSSSIHLLMDTCCFYVLAIVNSAAMNVGVHASFQIHECHGPLGEKVNCLSILFCAWLSQAEDLSEVPACSLTSQRWLLMSVAKSLLWWPESGRIWQWQQPTLITFQHSGFWVTYVCAQLLQSYPTLWDPMDLSLSGSSAHRDSPGKNTGVGCRALLLGIFLAQGLNRRFLHLMHWRQFLYLLSHPWSPIRCLSTLQQV